MIIIFSLNEYTNHEANALNVHIREFFLNIQKLPCGTIFDFSYIPNEGFRKKVKRSSNNSKDNSKSLYLYLEKFFNKFLTLDMEERENLVNNFIKATDNLKGIINDALENDLELKYQHYPKIQTELKELFKFLYEKTLPSSYNIKNHYFFIRENLIKNEIPIVCPICGIRPLSNPNTLKADYDHLLCQDVYPFSTVFLANLIPCCNECNRGEKRDKDILRNATNVRRKFKYPFASKIEINNSIKINAVLKDSCTNILDLEWTVHIEPNDEYTITWNDVYRIKERFAEEIETNFNNNWLKDFKSRYRKQIIKNKNKEEINRLLDDEIRVFQENPLGNQGFLIAPAFKAFKQHSEYVDILFEQIKSS